MTTVIDLPSLHMTHDELLDALERRRPWAERIDRKALTKHEREEKQYLTAFRSACRAALKWDYEKVKDNYGQIEIAPGRKFRNGDAPTCPKAVVPMLDTAIDFVKKDSRKTITLSAKGEWSSIYWLLTHDETASDKASLC